ncbi:MAG: ABC transporter permease subunit [Mobilitalea sp.]
MLNVIKMDLYRLIKTRSLYVILMIIAAFMMLNVYMLQREIEVLSFKQTETDNTQEVLKEDTTENVNLGISYDPSSLIRLDTTLLDEVEVMLTSGIMLLFTGIFVVIYVCGENTSGYIKNLVTCTKRRWYIILSKTVAMSVFVLFELLVVLIMTGIASSIFIDSITLNISGHLLQYLGLQFLLHTAFAVIIIMVSVLTRSTAISMIISICLCSGIGSLVIGFISKLNINGHYIGAKLPDYLITTNVQTLMSTPSSEMSIRVIAVSAIAILAYNLISCVVMEKRDI